MIRSQSRDLHLSSYNVPHSSSSHMHPANINRPRADAAWVQQHGPVRWLVRAMGLLEEIKMSLNHFLPPTFIPITSSLQDLYETHIPSITHPSCYFSSL
ncbi:hypothetical protein EYF80_003427 [Liparis tanakae]|uniref:Uncharacterized protein n=1 Tax=Liparis tanakae TaxID=230148 RepID=A0A4Z2JAC3_9TELE|nr:hypothetical protein EYF80_003427 [Liparis tanakae]